MKKKKKKIYIYFKIPEHLVHLTLKIDMSHGHINNNFGHQ